MADQTYNLTQTGAEVQAIINDANGVKGAGATTSLTTDYIMLKDTSGAYHKIQKSSFTEAVRNTLASLLVNNDKGTTISQIAAIASGDFGSVTLANLASVLGGISTTITSDNDLDNITGTGIYKFTNSTPQNSPVELGVVVVFSARLSGDICGVIQFASDTRGGRNKERAVPIYYRVAWTNTTNGWSKWVMINTTDV